MKDNMYRLLFLFCFTFLFLSVSAFSSFPILDDPNEGLYKKVGYLLGISMLIFGVIIAYAYNNKTMIKSAWRGFLIMILGFFIVISVAFVTFFFF